MLSGNNAVGITMHERWMAKASVKNNLKDGLKKYKLSGASEAACEGEALMYFQKRKFLETCSTISFENETKINDNSKDSSKDVIVFVAVIVSIISIVAMIATKEITIIIALIGIILTIYKIYDSSNSNKDNNSNNSNNNNNDTETTKVLYEFWGINFTIKCFEMFLYFVFIGIGWYSS